MDAWSMQRCLKTNTNFYMLLRAIWPATSMHMNGFTFKSSIHLYCWPDSQDSNKHRSEMCANCPTGTPNLFSITHSNVSDLELLSPLNMQSRNREKDCSTKYIALRKAYWTLGQGMLTYCYLCFCSVLTFYYWTRTQTIQSVRLTDFFWPYKQIIIDCTRVFLQYQTWNTVPIQKKKDSPSQHLCWQVRSIYLTVLHKTTTLIWCFYSK